MTSLRSLPLLALAIASSASASPAKRVPARPIAARAVAAANAASTVEPAANTFIAASAVLPFVDGQIYHVLTAPEAVTDILLQPGETLGSVAAGDTARWVIGDTTSGSGADKRAHVLVKPIGPGLATNLIITTDRRTYHLTLTSTAGPAMSALSWTYPQDSMLALKRAADATAAAVPVAAGLDIDQLHFDYAISGDKVAWRPLRAFDDGKQTYIELPAGLGATDAPPLFVIGAKGAAELVNFRLRGRYYVVDRLFDVAEMRLGTKHQQIVRIVRGTARRGRAA
ncbi:P-type conjugative transfer protein TrbG [Sphingomonas pruni]|uniref:P-type conjugative transfer protein TrbG n=1 Tax=Sphingomonas pruni TaxID=40683 RepID=UPI00082E7483|nr:P-type conjugative transfer protein TrbG [Sphingomonas pruni]